MADGYEQVFAKMLGVGASRELAALA